MYFKTGINTYIYYTAKKKKKAIYILHKIHILSLSEFGIYDKM